MEPERDLFLEQLHGAFPSEPILATGAFEQWGTTYPDAGAYIEQLDGKSWDRLDRAYIVRRSDALGFLGTKQLVGVLPVYLRAMVEQGVWSPATGMLTVILAKPLPGEDTGLGPARFDALVEALTGKQRAAVASALRAFADTDPDGSLGRAATTALDRCWNAHLQTERERAVECQAPKPGGDPINLEVLRNCRGR